MSNIPNLAQNTNKGVDTFSLPQTLVRSKWLGTNRVSVLLPLGPVIPKRSMFIFWLIFVFNTILQLSRGLKKA